VWAEFLHLHGEQLAAHEAISTSKVLVTKAKASIRKAIIQSFSPYARADTATPYLTKGYHVLGGGSSGRLSGLLAAPPAAAAAAAAASGGSEDDSPTTQQDGEGDLGGSGPAAAAAAVRGGRQRHSVSAASASRTAAAAAGMPDSIGDIGPLNLANSQQGST
jgi:hypothetical protein